MRDLIPANDFAALSEPWHRVIGEPGVQDLAELDLEEEAAAYYREQAAIDGADADVWGEPA